jgi:hypothetical protein
VLKKNGVEIKSSSFEVFAAHNTAKEIQLDIPDITNDAEYTLNVFALTRKVLPLKNLEVIPNNFSPWPESIVAI